MSKHKTPDWDDEPKQEEQASVAPAAKVRVRCITDDRPFTETKALANGEEGDCSPETAKVLVERGHVEYVK